MTRYYHLFPFERVPQGSRLIIYGAGEVGQWYLAQMEQTGYARAVAIADKAWDKYPPMGVPLIAPQAIVGQEYDYVLVSIENPEVARDVAGELELCHGVSSEKIVLGCESLAVEPNFIKPITKQSALQLAFESTNIPVAILLGGGLGDVIVFKRKLEEILKWDERIIIDLYVADKGVKPANSFIRAEYRNRVNAVIGGFRKYYNSNKEYYAVAMSVAVDLDIDVINENKLCFAPDLLKRFRMIQEQSSSYGNMDGLYFLHYLRCKKDGYNCYTSFNRYEGFDVQDWHTNIPIGEDGWRKYEQLGLQGQYITLNNGYDTSYKRVVAKSWPQHYFIDFVRRFNEKFPQIKIVQVSASGFPMIPGCDCYVIGRSLDLVKCVLKGAILHLDIEGGLTHLASQLGTRCTVLFGQTPIHYYGYAQNLNIKAGKCHDCVWYGNNSYECYRGLSVPACMQAITPELVVSEIEKNFFDVLYRRD